MRLSEKINDDFICKENHEKTIFLWLLSRKTPIKIDSKAFELIEQETGFNNSLEYCNEFIADGFFIEDNKAKEGNSYILTDKAKEFLLDNDIYIKLFTHSNWNVSIKDYFKYHKEGNNFSDTLLDIFKNRAEKDRLHFGINDYLFSYEVLNQEGRDKEALEMLLKILYIGLSGVELVGIVGEYTKGDINKEELREKFYSAFSIAFGLLNQISQSKYKKIFKEEMIDKLYKIELPIQLCDKEYFLNILNFVMAGEVSEEVARAKFRESYKKRLPGLSGMFYNCFN